MPYFQMYTAARAAAVIGVSLLTQASVAYFQASMASSGVVIGGFLLTQAPMHYFQTPMGSRLTPYFSPSIRKLLPNAHGFKRRAGWRFSVNASAADALLSKRPRPRPHIIRRQPLSAAYFQAPTPTALSAALIGGFALTQAPMHYSQAHTDSSTALVGDFLLTQLAH